MPTEVRAIFDTSAKANNGVALNDILETGPNLYPLLTDVLIGFCSHQIGLTADISKMFREILLHDTEKDLHHFVVWLGRLESSQPGFWSSNVFTRNGQVVTATREVLR